uniref:DUF4218 domain-containing protein n=1 Tax=Trichogramma kaykai TaxID=54128 RepID=A0ABD2WGA0_9HYME
MKTSTNIEVIKDINRTDDNDSEFAYIGLEKKLESLVNPNLHDFIIEITINIDGFAPFESSNLTIWPILIKIFHREHEYPPFTTAVYAGKSKPKDINAYLKDFINEINRLGSTGIMIKKKNYKLSIKFFVCDAPARSFLKAIVSQVAFDACERCEVKGKKIDSVTVFLNTKAKKRSDASFRNFETPDHHNATSPLCEIVPPINMVNHFVLDPMHLIYIGCTKRILEFLFQYPASKCPSKFSGSIKKEMERRTDLIIKDIPEDFPRKMRSIKDFTEYKAVEYKFFLLYASVFIFKKLVSRELYDSILLLVSSCRMLSAENALDYVEVARENLKTFVETAPAIYGNTFVSLNVHSLIHVPDDVEFTQCNLNEISAFCFESYLGLVGKYIRFPTHIVAQYCKRIDEKETYLSPLSTDKKVYQILKENNDSILKMTYKNFIFTNSHPNNTVLLKTNSIAVIDRIFKKENIIYIEVRKYSKKINVFEKPMKSSLINMWEISQLASNVEILQLSCIVKKLVKFNMNFTENDEMKIFAVSMLH